MMHSLIIASVAVCFHIVLVLGMLRMRVSVSPMLIHFISAIFVHLSLLVPYALGYVDGSYWHMASFFWSGIMAYLFRFSAVYKSISLRLLSRLLRSSGGYMLTDSLYQDVILRSFNDRIKVLSALGYVVQSQERFVVTSSGRLIAFRIESLRAIFSMRQTGIYFTKCD